MMQFVIAAPRSGSGKTTVTCALLAALKKRGMDPCAFKSGPDYIDPMFHRAVLGVESHNLDLYLSAKNTVRELYAHYAAGHGAVVCEGAMGFYDGQGLTTRASAWELADALDLPVLLVVQPKGASVTLAAEIQGLVHFKPESHIAGILLNDCSEKLFRMLKPLLETETGLPVLGHLPRLPEASIESRHLGLKTAGEIAGLQQKIALLADALVLDWVQFQALTDRSAPLAQPAARAPARTRIAVAQDEAFCFAYAETLDALRDAGAELVFFSPLRDQKIPENISGLIFGGGYPELNCKELSENNSMRRSVKDAIRSGMPCLAECGGFMYLHQEMEDMEGHSWPMAGVIPGKSWRTPRLTRFGYITLEDGTCFGKNVGGIRAHEFHYFDSDNCGESYTARKPLSSRSWNCIHSDRQGMSGFPHMYYYSNLQVPEQFLRTCEERKA